MDKFVYGKPEIDAEGTLQVMYRKDVFDRVRKKVKPQVSCWLNLGRAKFVI
jgi:hypothetical protein